MKKNSVTRDVLDRRGNEIAELECVGRLLCEVVVVPDLMGLMGMGIRSRRKRNHSRLGCRVETDSSCNKARFRLEEIKQHNTKSIAFPLLKPRQHPRIYPLDVVCLIPYRQHLGNEKVIKERFLGSRVT